MKKLILIFPIFTFAACELSGVETDELTGNDSIIANQGNDQQLDENGMKLADSINGKPNEMVFNREDGLRIEWTKKYGTTYSTE
ncbi:MAG: hypothetical protein IPM77_09425 [Crocinitomicaceae bacterium]|nr:hypothetical protein [Crocinitomicaceae bacterium]